MDLSQIIIKRLEKVSKGMTQDSLRGFQVIQAYQDQAIRLPQRQTPHSAGYDLEAAETVILPSFWKRTIRHYLHVLKGSLTGESDNEGDHGALWQATLVPTGLKAYMQENEYLKIVNRSSGSYKHQTTLPNGIGIIDADYYDNPNNEGHIYVQLINYGLKDRTIHKGERIAQGIFTQYLLVDGDQARVTPRRGGFGSSDRDPLERSL